MSSTYVYASRQVEAALLQESFPHSILLDTEDDPVSRQTVLQAIAEIARFLKNFKCDNVGIECFIAQLSTGIEFVTFKCLVCLPQNVLVQFLQTFDSHCSNDQRFNKLRRARFALDVGDNSVVLP